MNGVYYSVNTIHDADLSLGLKFMFQCIKSLRVSFKAAPHSGGISPN